MYKGLTRDRRDGCRIKKHCKNFVSTSSQFVQFVHGRTTIDVRYGNYKYFPPFNPLIFRLACSNSIASRAQHYSVPSITRNKSRRKFYHIEGGNYCSKSSPRIFCTFMEHPVHDACLDRVFSFVFTSRKVGSPSSPCYWKSFRVFAGKIDSPHPAWKIFCIVFAVKEPGRIKPENSVLPLPSEIPPYCSGD